MAARIWYGSLLFAIFLQWTHAQIKESISIIPGFDLVIPSTNLPNDYGYEVTLRSQYLPNGAQKSWILTQQLPSGLLTNFFLYVHNISTPTVPVSQSFVRLQIWRLISIALFQYALVWEKRVLLALNSSTTGAFWNFTLATGDEFRTRAGDLIGFTYEDTFGVISFDYKVSSTTLFDKPVVGASGAAILPTCCDATVPYTFQSTPLPAEFAVGVEINPTAPVAPPCSNAGNTNLGTGNAGQLIEKDEYYFFAFLALLVPIVAVIVGVVICVKRTKKGHEASRSQQHSSATNLQTSFDQGPLYDTDRMRPQASVTPTSVSYVNDGQSHEPAAGHRMRTASSHGSTEYQNEMDINRPYYLGLTTEPREERYEELQPTTGVRRLAEMYENE